MYYFIINVKDRIVLSKLLVYNYFFFVYLRLRNFTTGIQVINLSFITPLNIHISSAKCRHIMKDEHFLYLQFHYRRDVVE